MTIMSMKHIKFIMSIIFKRNCLLWLAVLSDDEPGPSNDLDHVDQEFVPEGIRTPPTPPSQSPPPASAPSRRVPALAQLRPVSIPSVVQDMALVWVLN